MENTTELTVKEALKQGYEYYGFKNVDWQNLQELDENVFNEVDESSWDNLVLFDKESKFPMMDKDDIAEIMANRAAENDSEVCNREDDEVYDAVRAVDFAEITDTINKALEVHSYRMLTDIKLVQ
jgi:hypothetical protein